MKALLSIATATACLAGGAQAQRMPVGERTTPDSTRAFEDLKEGERPDSKGTRRVVQEFARCIARRDSTRVAKFLATKSQRLSSTLGSQASECLGNAAGDDSMLKGKADTFRYALAEAYLVRKYRDAGVSDLVRIAPLDHPGETVGDKQGLGMLSECIIRKAPGESWNLLRTDAASAEEQTAFAALGSAMQSCVRRGTTMKMPAFFVRGAIAQTYYMLSMAPRATAGGAR